MIIDAHKTVTGNVTGSTEFSVSDNSAKIFSFLSNFLYKDKERSVMTELCSNALDAHVAAGVAMQPIQVTLPTDLSQEFKVRDFGHGLSETNVYKFLTKYGESSKGDSNEMIGGFGIGSKSPAAVTDTWTINSYHDGSMSSYLIHVNSHGIPSITKLFSRETAESGLEVVVPTKMPKFWVNSAVEVFQHYDVKPVIKGKSVTFDTRETKTLYDGLVIAYIVSESHRSYDSYATIKVKLNRRVYSVDSSKLKVKTPFRSDIILPFDIGTLSVSLSREDLQYDTKTINAINERLDVIIREKLQALWDAEVLPAADVFSYQMAAAGFKKIHNIKTETCQYLGSASQFTMSVDYGALDSFKVSLPFAVSSTVESKHIQEFNVPMGKMLAPNSRQRNSAFGLDYSNRAPNGSFEKYKVSFGASSLEAIVFVLNDAPTAPSRVKAKYASGAGNLKTVLILPQSVWDAIPSVFTKIKASSLPVPPRVPRTKEVKVASQYYQLYGKQFEPINESSIRKSNGETVLVIPFTNMNTSTSIIDPMDASYLKTARTQFEAQVVFVKKDTPMPKWGMSVKQYLEIEHKKLMVSLPSMKIASLKNSIMGGLERSIAKYRTHFAANCPKSASLQALLVDIELAEKMSSSDKLTFNVAYDRLLKCSSLLGLHDAAVKSNHMDALLQAHPMLKFVFTIDSFDLNTVVNYINQ